VDANEQFVREKWNLVHCCDGSYRNYRRGTILIQDTPGHWLDFQGWIPAAEFTRQREEDIRQVEEEIAEIRKDFEVFAADDLQRIKGDPLNPETAIYGRVLAREQELLATLKRGLRASFDQEGSVGK
jgi:hypothetical protein